MRKFNCVFLVEDSEIDTWIALKVLEFAEIAKFVLNATDASSALFQLKEYAQQHNALPEIILVDLGMPIIDGFELIGKIRKLECFDELKNQVILVTEGLDSSNDLPKVQQMGIKYVIIKPLSKEKLMAVIESFRKDIL